ncbi:hypothetical protein BJ508DRAFT_313404 [Ascobolus immersus RN42]|uniref:F-box domain-containing protein n=1 Tax=Ascobolus immersus RN42 TaxID=1160509 RepID=A0A3N4HPZ1_ASCIM|nr:hypothetical protein BJ508DRAFT_313404 [Ascobolus immersus RN42]
MATLWPPTGASLFHSWSGSLDSYDHKYDTINDSGLEWYKQIIICLSKVERYLIDRCLSPETKDRMVEQEVYTDRTVLLVSYVVHATSEPRGDHPKSTNVLIDKAPPPNDPCTTSTMASIDTLPNELKSLILTFVNGLKDYDMMSLTNHKWHAIAKVQSTRNRFATNWFAKNFNDIDAPKDIELIIRVLLKHLPNSIVLDYLDNSRKLGLESLYCNAWWIVESQYPIVAVSEDDQRGAGARSLLIILSMIPGNFRVAYGSRIRARENRRKLNSLSTRIEGLDLDLDDVVLGLLLMQAWNNGVKCSLKDMTARLKWSIWHFKLPESLLEWDEIKEFWFRPSFYYKLKQASTSN